jgi:hypothetical protein
LVPTSYVTGSWLNDTLDSNIALQVNDPTTDDTGAGAGPNFQGDREARRFLSETSGVVENRPGLIESTNIDPLNENSNKGAPPDCLVRR